MHRVLLVAVRQKREREAEQQREEDALQQVCGVHGGKDVGRDDADERIQNVHALGLARRQIAQVNRDALADREEIGHHQTNANSDRRRQHKDDKRSSGPLAELLHASNVSSRRDQQAHDQRNNHHVQKIGQDRAQELELLAKLRGHDAQCDTQDKADEYPGKQSNLFPIFHHRNLLFATQLLSYCTVASGCYYIFPLKFGQFE